MRGFRSDSYGDAFADVYDDWYGEISDPVTTASFVAGLAGPGGAVLELGVGTGRLAMPIAARVGRFVGIDTSTRMLDRWRSRVDAAVAAGELAAGTVEAVVGDMVDDLPPGPYDVAFAAYNTLFNLTSADRQRALFARLAERIRPGGSFVVECFVPHDTPDTPDTHDTSGTSGTSDTGGEQRLALRSMTVDTVVLSASRHDLAAQTAEGHFIEITEAGGVRLRPWAIRWSTTDELDEMAADTGFVLGGRWADFDRRPFVAAGVAGTGDADDTSERHVTLYTRR